jgi:hypothetical protein
MKANALPFKPLLAALALVLATTACQQRDDTMPRPCLRSRPTPWRHRRRCRKSIPAPG